MLTLVGILSCSDDGDLGDKNDFDQQPLLDNLGQNIIVPAYENLASQTESLRSSVETLLQDLSQENLAQAREQLLTTRLAWQACSFYQFGPASSNGLSATLNLYPVDENQIENNIESQSYDLNTTSNFDARGFQTIGYLLYSTSETDAEILTALANEARAQYLLDVAQLIAESSSATYNDWKVDGGNYLATFTDSDALGVSAGSSIGQFINAYIQDYERNIRDAKVGIPVGIRSLGEEIPKNVEAYYAGYSVTLVNESITQLLSMYNGENGVGFDDYMVALEAVSTDNNQLNEAIIAQFQSILTAIAVLDNPLSEQVQSNKSAVEEVFIQMQGLATLMKTDMASQIGVAITFQDSDGD